MNSYNVSMNLTLKNLDCKNWKSIVYLYFVEWREWWELFEEDENLVKKSTDLTSNISFTFTLKLVYCKSILYNDLVIILWENIIFIIRYYLYLTTQL